MLEFTLQLKYHKIHLNAFGFIKRPTFSMAFEILKFIPPTNRIILMQYVTPLVIDKEEEREGDHDEAENDEDHHNEAAVHETGALLRLLHARKIVGIVVEISDKR